MAIDNMLYNIRNCVRGLAPIYISICAALLLDLKANLKFDLASLLYFGGLISFGLACIISNRLSNRCNDYGRIYDIEFQSNGKKNIRERKTIYNDYENEINEKIHKYRFSKIGRYFNYYGVFVFGVLGLGLVLGSYCFSINQKKMMLQHQEDFFKVENIEYKEQIDSLEAVNIEYKEQIDSLKAVNIEYKEQVLIKDKECFYQGQQIQAQ